MKKLISMLLVGAMIFAFCSCSNSAGNSADVNESDTPITTSLPKAEPDSENQFGIDKNINIANIDSYLGRDDTVYRDMRLLFDPADYAAIGGEADLTTSIKGFRITPFPYISTLQTLPVEGAYQGDCLYTVEWNDDGSVKSASPNYEESEIIIKELFPQDKNIFLICGGGGYAGMTRSLLIYLGWDETKVYNVGAAWNYDGDNKVELVIYPENADDDTILATWRADYAYIEFSKLHDMEKK